MKILLTALAVAAALIYAPQAHATRMCEQNLWTTVCRNDDGTWVGCGLHGPGCEPLPLTGQDALPGMTPSPDK